MQRHFPGKDNLVAALKARDLDPLWNSVL
jgi:hypothetical protein